MKEPEPPLVDAVLSCRAAGGLSVDARSFSFLLARNLTHQERENEEDEEKNVCGEAEGDCGGDGEGAFCSGAE